MGRRGASAGAEIAFALIATGVAACSLADFSAYTNGEDRRDGGSPDGAAPANDGGAGGDGSVPATNDAGADASGDAAAAQRFCERNADAGFFCEDFEGPNPLLHFASTVGKNGTLVVDNRTMVADAPANANASEVYGVISPAKSGSQAHLEFSVQPEVLNLTTNHDTQLAKFLFYGAATYEVGIGIKGTTSTVYTYEYVPGYYKEFGTLPKLQANAFTRFVLDVRIDGASRRIDVDRDGVRVVNGATLTPPFTQGVMEAFVGIPYTQPGHGPWRFRFDDYLMRVP